MRYLTRLPGPANIVERQAYGRGFWAELIIDHRPLRSDWSRVGG